MRKKILLLSGYDAASHLYWRRLLADSLPEYQWTQLALPDRHFYWRVRGNALTFAHSHTTELQQDYDLIVATSMVDLCGLRGFVPALGRVPSVVYFHENQFAFPMKTPSSNIVSAQLTSVYSALCADRILFNSEYNRESFFCGANELLNKMPDGVERNLLQPVEARAQVLPVPLKNLDDANCAERMPASVGKPFEIVWNHRWEYDKQPEVFFEVMKRLKEAGVALRLHVMGQSFRQVPDCFADARGSLSDEIVTWGFQSEQHYHAILETADIVVSTALHDFQGLSMLEAIQRGCVPVAPNRVAYPEYIPPSLLYSVEPDEVGGAVKKMLELLSAPLPKSPEVKGYESTALVSQYNAVFSDLLDTA